MALQQFKISVVKYILWAEEFFTRLSELLTVNLCVETFVKYFCRLVVAMHACMHGTIQPKNNIIKSLGVYLQEVWPARMRKSNDTLGVSSAVDAPGHVVR